MVHLVARPCQDHPGQQRIDVVVLGEQHAQRPDRRPRGLVGELGRIHEIGRAGAGRVPSTTRRSSSEARRRGLSR